MSNDRSGWSGSAEPPGMAGWRPQAADIALIVLLALYLRPIWSVARLPTQDGPSHVYNARLLLQLARPTLSNPVSEVFAIRREPFPNWAGHAVLATLMGLGLGPLVAEKVLVSAYVAGMAVGSRYLLRSVAPGQEIWAPLSLPLAFNFPFFMGYYNFLVGIPPTLFLLGFGWRSRHHLRFFQGLGISAALVAIYFAHLVDFGVASLGLAVLLVGGAGRGRWFDVLGKLDLIYLPSLILLAWYVTASDRGYVSDAHPWEVVQGSDDGVGKLFGRFSASILTPTPRHAPIAAEVVLIAVLGVAAAGSVAAIRSRGLASFARFSAIKGPFLVVTAELASLALLFPQNWGNHGGAFTERMAIFIGLLGLACLPVPRTRWGLALTLTVVVIAAAMDLIAVGAEIRDGDRDLTTLLIGVPELPGGSRVLPILFHPQPENRVLLREHLVNYLCLRDGVVNWDNYEARGFCFPVRFRPEIDPPDPSSLRRGDDSKMGRDLGRTDLAIVGPACPSKLRVRMAATFPAAWPVGRLTIYSRLPSVPPGR